MRLEGNEGASHMDIQKKSGPGGGNVSAKVLRHARRVRGTARSQGGWSSVGHEDEWKMSERHGLGRSRGSSEGSGSDGEPGERSIQRSDVISYML